MDLIKLDDCFAQPDAILIITAERYFDEFIFSLRTKEGGTVEDDWGWFDVINIVFTNHEKHMIRFIDRAKRDARFAEIVEQLKNA